MSRPVVIGGGHNGLVCAALLARAGLRPLVLEATGEVGGCAVTRELAPGFHVPALAHSVTLRADVIAALNLEARGLRVIRPPVAAAIPSQDGRLLTLPADTDAAARALAAFSSRDATRWAAFCATTRAIVSALEGLLVKVPPSIDQPAVAEVWDLVQVGRRVRGLGRARLYELLRWGPMAIADLAREWFETPALAAALCSRGIFGMHAGPRSAGTAAQWLLQVANEGHPVGLVGMVHGGPGAVGAALAEAATSAGAEIRRGTRVSQIDVDDGGACGVRLENGTNIQTRSVVAAIDPRQAFLALVDAGRLPPTFRQQVLNYRCNGSVAKINLALSGLPTIRGLDATGLSPEQALSGRLLVSSHPDEIEQAFDCAKYGQMSDRPWLEVTIPSLTDQSLAPPGQHVMSIYVQWAPYRLREGRWDDLRGALEERALRRLAEIAPDLPARVIASEVLTPVDLERQYGLTGGHVFHGEHALDQLYAMRPVLGWAQHRTPIKGLYLCGAGTHPGGGVTGAPGAHGARVVLKDLRRSR